MYWISTLLASLLDLVNILGIKALLVSIVVVWGYLLSVICIILVNGWSRFHKRLLLLFACWEICVLVSHKINLCCLRVTCHLLDMPGGCLWTLHLLCKLPDLVCGKPVQVYVAIIYCLGDKLFIFKEEPKNVPVKHLGSLRGLLSQSNLDLDSIIPLIHWHVSLLEACEMIKPSPHFIWLRLAELFKLLPNCFKH